MPATFQRVARVQCRDDKNEIVYAEVKYEIEVDPDKIAGRLGWKALHNKSRRSLVATGVKLSVLRDIPKGWRLTGF